MLNYRTIIGLAFLLTATFGLNTRAFAQTITTVAGTGTAGSSGDAGPASSAQVNGPANIYMDGSGNLYITDHIGNQIRRIDAVTGIITTVAGTGVAGPAGDGGLAVSAQLNNPNGIYVDGPGNIFFADQGNHRVRRIDAVTGIVTTIAGTGIAGYLGDGGPATAARLNIPTRMSADSAGNLFFGDQSNNRVRRIDAVTGFITTVAGTGVAGSAGDGGLAVSAQLNNPNGVYVDDADNLYIATLGDHRVRRIDAATGIITTVAGTGAAGPAGDGGLAVSAQLNQPFKVVKDAIGNLYIADALNHRVRRIDATTGIITTVAGTGVAGYSGDGADPVNAQLNYPVGLFVDNVGSLYIAEYLGHRVRMVNMPFLTAVTHTADSGTGSLRQTILYANSNPGTDTITFDISGPGPHTIQLQSPLPNITDPVVIDGTSEPDFVGTPIIELDGSNAGVGASGLHITAGSSTVKGLVINRFNFAGIGLSGGGGNVIEGNYIGTDVSGTVALGNGGTGGSGGVGVSSPNNTIGGTSPAARNLISGNTTYGIFISGVAGNVIEGNYIGTDVSGTAALPNVNGVRVQVSAGGLIGGTATGVGNLISGNSQQGIVIFSGSSNYQVQGNYIGTDASGIAPLGNGTAGISVWSASNITIGGTASGAGNLVSGNNGSGISIDETGNRVEGNIIGADVSGTAALGNTGSGVWTGSGIRVGGLASEAGNLIAYNSQFGVRVGGTGNAIWSNEIHSNSNLGIALGVAGVTPNDVGDGDTGNNDLQNYPVLSAAFTSNSTISGSLNSTANTTFRLEFFAGSACDASGFGEGESFLSSTDVTTNGSGNISFTVPLPSGVVLGDFITATATNPSNNTSEFSQCIEVIEGSVTVTVPDTMATYSEMLQIPVQVSDTSGQGVVAAEAFISYDGDLLTAFSVGTSNTLLTGNWSVEINIIQGNGTHTDTIKMAMATNNDALVGAGTLMNINFQVADIRHPASSPLTLEHVLFNDGMPGNITANGSVTLVGIDGILTSTSATIIPREEITVTVTDADEDRDGNNPDSFDVAVANGAQTETLALTETGNSTGIFIGTISTIFSLGATSGDGTVQAKAGDAIVFTYADSLDVTGNTVPRSDQTNVIGGTDGALRVTIVSQPGDLVRIRVTDSDLNVDPGNPESVVVTVVNPQTSESEAVTLDEDGVNSDIFFGTVATTLGTVAGTDDDGTFNTQKGDVLDVIYDDIVTAQGGTASLSDDDEVVNPFGDADGNAAVQAFDAARALLHVLSPYLTGLDSLSANVDLSAFDPVLGKITPFDASLILQKRVGLIALFPIQEDEADNHPQPETDNSVPKFLPDERLLSLQLNEGYLSIWVDELAAILSGEIVVQGIEGQVQMGAELSDFLFASRKTDDGLRIVFAGASPVSGSGELLRIYPGVGPDRVYAEGRASQGDAVSLTRATFNDGQIAAQALMSGYTAPAAFILHANMPNPFNPETTIRFELPRASVVKLEVFDVLGQRVRTLVAEALPAGMHQVVWDGRSERGAAVGNGLYLYRLEAGDFAQMRRMLLLK
ncbi:MAG: hypothetical protein HOC74_08470 [Gemmatimonadetes bacterium]|nr:hypothetical protein [Gemmatimonadota bacterium]